MMTIKLFAVLKEYFEEAYEVRDIKTIGALRTHLVEINPDAQTILNSCRFAINNHFVPLDTSLNDQDTIFVMPPSSGG